MKPHFEYKLWTDEYFQAMICDKIKSEISMLFTVRHKRRPTKQEYEEWFDKFIKGAVCEVTDYDLGIYND